MSTRCRIGIQNQDGSVTSIYCHHDGYYSYVGRVLVNYYKDEETVRKLLALGDMSALGSHPVDEDTREVPDGVDDYINWACSPYSLRDEECPATTVASVTEYYDQLAEEYNYLFCDGSWHDVIKNSDGTITVYPITEQIRKIEAEEEAEEEAEKKAVVDDKFMPGEHVSWNGDGNYTVIRKLPEDIKISCPLLQNDLTYYEIEYVSETLGRIVYTVWEDKLEKIPDTHRPKISVGDNW